MRGENVSALLVDNGAGIISERDMTRALAAGLGPESPVSEVDTPWPITVPGEMTIQDAAALMLNEDVRHLVVRSAVNWLEKTFVPQGVTAKNRG
jgi:CBS domain-containing protein